MRARSFWIAGLLAFLAVAGAADTGANAPTVTGETGYFTLFTGVTLPRGGWSFGLYYNNWDRLVIPDAPPTFLPPPGSSSGGVSGRSKSRSSSGSASRSLTFSILTRRCLARPIVPRATAGRAPAGSRALDPGDVDCGTA